MRTTTLTNNSYILGVFSPLVFCYESQLTWIWSLYKQVWTGQAWVVAAWPCTEDTVPCVQVRLLARPLRCRT